MAKIRSTALPTARSCGCGGVMQPARRFEATRTISVTICWSCGAEDPPMRCDYRTPAPTTLPYCRYCGEKFTPTDPRQRYCPDRDCADRAGRITLDRRHTGQRIRRRAS